MLAPLAMPSCKVIGLPIRVAGAVVESGASAWDDAAEKRRVRKEKKRAREEAGKRQQEAREKQASPPAGLPPLPAENPAVLPPLPDNGRPADTLPPLPE